MPEAPMAELTYKDRLKLELFPTIWCPGCGIGTIMMMLAMVLVVFAGLVRCRRGGKESGAFRGIDAKRMQLGGRATSWRFVER